MITSFFIHIPKNAGMTVRNSEVLSGRIGTAHKGTHISKEYTQKLEETMRASQDGNGYEHARYRDIDPQWTKKFKAFAIIRNPWSRVVSRYYFAQKLIERMGKHPVGYADISSLEAFLEERHIWGNKEFYWHRAIRGWYPAKEHVIDHNGIVKCDIMRFEHLNEDLQKYFGIGAMTRARNVTFGTIPRPSYTEIYTPKTIQIVADWYKDDIDQWGHDFDTSATKNYWNNK